MRTTFQEELQAMFCKRSNKTYSVNKLMTITKSKELPLLCQTQELGKKQENIKKKKGVTRTCCMFSNIEPSDINVTYNNVVLRYLLEFCSMCKPADVIGFKKCCKIYHCMSPQRLGRLGCIWPTDKALQWFEAFYLIKLYICYPGNPNDYHFLPLNSDEDLELTQDQLFMPRVGKCAPYDLVILVFNGSHYENTINDYNKDTPFFHVGERLPDLVYQMCQITPDV